MAAWVRAQPLTADAEVVSSMVPKHGVSQGEAQATEPANKREEKERAPAYEAADRSNDSNKKCIIRRAARESGGLGSPVGSIRTRIGNAADSSRWMEARSSTRV